MEKKIKQVKIDNVATCVDRLQKKANFVLTNYSGIKVKEINELRNNLRAKGIDYKVIKNTLFKRALDQNNYVDISKHLKGPIAVVFTEHDLSEAAKILRNFKKVQEKFNFSVGIMDNQVFTSAEIEKIADLPSKEELLAKILYMVNAPTTRVATGMNQIMASLARGIQAVAEKNGN